MTIDLSNRPFRVFCEGSLIAFPANETAWKRVVEKMNVCAYPIVRGDRIGKKPEIEVRTHPSGDIIFYQIGDA